MRLWVLSMMMVMCFGMLSRGELSQTYKKTGTDTKLSLSLFSRDDMQAQDSDIALPQKRGRSPSEASSFTPPNQQDQEATMLTRQDELHASRSRYTRPPKRARKSKDVPDYDEAPEKHILAGMEKSNPLGRKALKAKAKKARHAGRVRGDASGNGVGMEIDGEGLGFTFMA